MLGTGYNGEIFLGIAKGIFMDTQVVTIDTTNYDMVAAAMGMQDNSGPPSRSADALCRMRIWNKAIMGTMKSCLCDLFYSGTDIIGGCPSLHPIPRDEKAGM